ncbi:MAG: serine hydrolase domain-containing protein [Ferruginibacter sp.]
MQLVAVPDTSFAIGRFAYSNSNYVILEKIIEIITNQKATDIFNTFYSNLGFINTSFNKQSTGNQAFFAQQVNGTSNISAWEENYGFEGGAYATTEDLSKVLQQTFVDKTIINSQSLAGIQSWVDMDRFKINFGNGKITSYGLGLMKYEVSGRTFIGHAGSSLKYQSFVFIESATGIQVVLLTNCSGKYYNNAFLIEIIDKIISKNI